MVSLHSDDCPILSIASTFLWSSGSAWVWLVRSGSLMATGSADASMKVLGVGKVSLFACGLSGPAAVIYSVLPEFENRALPDAELLAEWAIGG